MSVRCQPKWKIFSGRCEEDSSEKRKSGFLTNRYLVLTVIYVGKKEVMDMAKDPVCGMEVEQGKVCSTHEVGALGSGLKISIFERN